MLSNLAGVYHIDKSNLVKPGIHLVIGTRKKPTPNKPKYYLLRRDSPSKHVFISSLYPEGQEGAENSLQAYSLDWGGVRYKLIINSAEGTAAMAVYSTNSNNIVELGCDSHPVDCISGNFKTYPDAAA